MDTPAASGSVEAGRADVNGPSLIVFDVNETLSDMSPIARRFTDVGAPAHLGTTWFAGVLRDGFAMTAAGAPASFAEIGAGLLQLELSRLTLDRDLASAVDHVMDGMDHLELHRDVAPAIQSLADRGLRLVTLSNGSVDATTGLLRRADVLDPVELVLSVEDAGAWKPAGRAYHYALNRCHVVPAETMLVAVHPWDIHGASCVGLRTAWLNRTGEPYPAYFSPPDLEIAALSDLAPALADRSS